MSRNDLGTLRNITDKCPSKAASLQLPVQGFDLDDFLEEFLFDLPESDTSRTLSVGRTTRCHCLRKDAIMLTSRRLFLAGLAGLGLVGCQGSRTVAKTKPKSTAPAATAESDSEIRQVSATARDPFVVRLETTKGDVLIKVHPDWAPRGAKRFRELVESGFYDGCKFFRVIDGFMAQVGMSGDPALNSQWDKKKLRDDPVIQSNKPGFVTFATSGVDSRTTQFFINVGDNSKLDSQGFSPFGKVIQGQEIVESLYNRYGEQPNQDRIRRSGNSYLETEFPQLDAIVRATVEE